MTKPSIAAILPAFNEEISLGSVVLRTRQHADRVFVVDDGSTDRTAEVAGLAGVECRPIWLIPVDILWFAVSLRNGGGREGLRWN